MIKSVLIDHMGTLVYEQSEYLEKLMRVSKEEIIAASKKVHLDTIFLLTGSDK